MFFSPQVLMDVIFIYVLHYPCLLAASDQARVGIVITILGLTMTTSLDLDKRKRKTIYGLHTFF